MGCGFSTNKSAERERILEGNNSSTMGSTGSKNKNGSRGSPSKKKSIQELTEKHNNKTNNGKNNNGSRKMMTSNGSSSLSTSAPFNIQSAEISSSQVNFFKMLDEKIENGAELEEHDFEQERQNHLLRVAEEWDTLLGRSQDSTDLQSKESAAAENPEQLDTLIRKRLVAEPSITVASSSVDSMRTMFSNSVTMPAGTLVEVAGSSVASSQSGSIGRSEART